MVDKDLPKAIMDLEAEIFGFSAYEQHEEKIWASLPDIQSIALKVAQK
jgi:hypothetical protein